MTSPVQVKICGLRRIEDAYAAVQAGADYLGFILALGSPRTITPEELAALRRGIDLGATRIVGVVRDQPAAWINDAVRSCGLDYVQLHGHEPRDFAAALAVPVLRVVRLRGATGAARVEVARPAARLDAEGAMRGALAPAGLPPNVFAVLFDAETAAGQSGGLGLRPDAGALAAARAALPDATRVFLSGGLTPENVALAVRTIRPFAVDVSSGVEHSPGKEVSSGLEHSPGIKDAARIAAFVAAAKGAL